MTDQSRKSWYDLRTLWQRSRGIVAFGLTGSVAALPSSMPSSDISDPPSKTRAVAPALVFEGVTVVDVEHGRLIPAQRIVIVGTRIQSISPMTAGQAPKGAQIVDARGKYMIPGLWDMHFHSFRGSTHSNHQLLIANGVTGVRDAASEWPLDSLVAWRRQVLVGTRAGPPRQILSGVSINNMNDCRDKFALHHTCVRDSAEAMHLVDSLKAAGADMLKMYRLPDKMYFIIAAKARRMGMPFGGHRQGLEIPASDSGAGIIDHSYSDGELVTQCIFGEGSGAKHVKASLEKCRPVAERFARNNTWFVPTWAVLGIRPTGHARTTFVYKEFDQFVIDFLRTDSVPPASKHLHEYLHRGFLTPILPKKSSLFGDVAQTSASVDSVGYLDIAQRAGLPILAGTDCGISKPIAGYSIHVEMAAFVAEGMTPVNALRTATLHPAKFLRATDSLGAVAAGKVADLVLLDGDPLADITNTAAIRAVVANGRYLDRPTLDSLLTEAQRRPR